MKEEEAAVQPEEEEPVKAGSAAEEEPPALATPEGATGPAAATDVVEEGAVVWARLRGFQWWPARVRRLLAEKESVAVRFCGTRDFGVVGHAPDGVRPFDDHPGWCDAPPAKRSHRAKYSAAVREARAAAAGEASPMPSQCSDLDEDEGEEGEGEGEEAEAEGAEAEEEEEEAEEEEAYKPPWAVGTLLWAKVRGFPTWPAAVEAPPPELLPPPAPANAHAFVRFFATKDAAWVAAADAAPFADRRDELVGANVLKKTSKGTLRAKYKQACDEIVAAAANGAGARAGAGGEGRGGGAGAGGEGGGRGGAKGQAARQSRRGERRRAQGGRVDGDEGEKRRPPSEIFVLRRPLPLPLGLNLGDGDGHLRCRERFALSRLRFLRSPPCLPLLHRCR